MVKFEFITNKEQIEWKPKIRYTMGSLGLLQGSYEPWLATFLLKIERLTGKQEVTRTEPNLDNFELDINKYYYIKFEDSLNVFDFDISDLPKPIMKMELKMFLDRYPDGPEE